MFVYVGLRPPPGLRPGQGLLLHHREGHRGRPRHRRRDGRVRRGRGGRRGGEARGGAGGGGAMKKKTHLEATPFEQEFKVLFDEVQCISFVIVRGTVFFY